MSNCINCMMPQGHPTHCGCEPERNPFFNPEPAASLLRERAKLAQPAEAEGVGVVAEAYSHRSRDSMKVTVMNIRQIGRLRDGDKLVRQSDHLAALSAVTAEVEGLRKERDRLRAEVEALRAALFGIASVNPAERGIEWAKSYASDGLKGAGSEPYARWLETFKEAEALRKAFMRMRNVASGYSNCCEFDSANTRRLEREFEAADELFRSSAAIAASTNKESKL